MTVAWGVDVSWYQGQINWNQVYAAGKRFAIIRATLGYTYTDPNYAANAAGARNAGVAVGAYHVFKPSQDALTQAAHFYSVVGKLRDGDVIPRSAGLVRVVQQHAGHGVKAVWLDALRRTSIQLDRQSRRRQRQLRPELCARLRRYSALG